MIKALTVACIGLVVACGSRTEHEPSADKPSKPGRRAQIVYDLDLDKAVDDWANVTRRDLEAALADHHIVATVKVSATTPGVLAMAPTDDANRDAIDQLVKVTYSDTVERRDCEPSDGLKAICIEIAASHARAIKKAALASAVSTIRERLVATKVEDPTVVEKAGQIVVEFPENDPQGLAMQSLISRTGKLEFKVVDDGSEYMKAVFAHVGSTRGNGDPTDPRAIDDEITAQVDMWKPDDGGPNHTDYYLVAHDRDALVSVERARQLACPSSTLDNGQVHCHVSGRSVIEAYLADLSAKDPAFRVPDDRQIGYEPDEPAPDAKDRRPYWRTYYLERAVRLSGAAIAKATPSYDPNTNRPIVLLDFDRVGTRVFAELTTQIVGKKLATILDGTIKSAPIINGAIRGGRAAITMGGSDASKQEAERDELVSVLKTGSLPSPLRESSSKIVP